MENEWTPDFTRSEADAAMIAQTVVSRFENSQRIGYFTKLSQLKSFCLREGRSVIMSSSAPGEHRETIDRCTCSTGREVLRLFQKHPEVIKVYERSMDFLSMNTRTLTVQWTSPRCSFMSLDPLPSQALSLELCAPLITPGDPDQAIYGFRGSDVTCFHRFEEDFPGTKKLMLSRNYRSTQTILDSAASLMQKDKALEASRDKGDPIRFASCRTEKEEAEMIVEQIEKLIGGTSTAFDSGGSLPRNGENLGSGMAVLYLNVRGLRRHFRGQDSFVRSKNL
jgi:hypothetical protein